MEAGALYISDVCDTSYITNNTFSKISTFYADSSVVTFIDNILYRSGSITDGTPTATELNNIIGLTAVLAKNGYRVRIVDSDGSGLIYEVWSDGTNWWYRVLTKAT